LASRPNYRDIDADDLYRRLATGEPIIVLDVRTETEFAKLHIPGAILIPLHLLESRHEEVPNSGTPVAIVSEHDSRSESACLFLAEHGHGPLFHLNGGMEAWQGPVSAGLDDHGRSDRIIAPSRFLVEAFDLLPKGVALDLAMGGGRNALYLATRGFDVDGVDAEAESVAAARAKARRLGTPIRAVVGNVEDGTYIIPLDAYDVICVFNYLHRPLFNDIRGGLRPGGAVVYQTFTTEQLNLGSGPTNPDYLLKPGELKQAFSDWEILRYREYVEYEGPGNPPRALAGIVARKPDDVD
jgi:rhodanese-related sulfurtransferase